jgi:hypothetical protein
MQMATSNKMYPRVKEINKVEIKRELNINAAAYMLNSLNTM